MARPLPADFTPIRPEVPAPGRFIIEGSDAPIQGETDLVENLHWCLAKLRTPILSTPFYNDSGAGAGIQAYAFGAGAATIRASWVVPVLPGPWVSWEFRVLASNTDGANAGTVRFERSDGTGVNISVTAGATAWTSFTGTLAQDTTLDTDVLCMKMTNPAAGEVRVHWVEVRPAALTSIPGTKFVLEGGEVWCPIDALEVDVQSPLSVALRRRELEDVEAIRQSRIETIVGWSDLANFRSPAYTASGSYVTVLRVLFRAGPLRTKIRWGALAYIPSGTGSVRISTQTMKAAGNDGIEAALFVGWTTPYADNVILWSDGGLGALDCTPNAWDELIIELDGTTATLMGLTAWLVDE